MDIQAGNENVIYDHPQSIPSALFADCGNVMLRPVTYADTDVIVTWRNDPAVRDRFVFREPFTHAMHVKWLETRVAAGSVVQFMICEKKDLRPVGSVYLRDIDKDALSAEYGIFIGESDARGKGYASAVVGQVVRYAFDTLRLKRIGLRVYTDNAPAIASYRRAGFRVVKTMPAVRSTDGKEADMYWMELRTNNPG